LKNVLRTAAVCGLALASVSGSAFAQTKSRYEVNSTAFKLGFFSPSGGPARRVGGSQLVNVEADVIAQYIPERMMTSVVSIGYIERDGFRMIPITVNQLFHDNKKTSGYDVYYGYGLGLYSARLATVDTSGSAKTLIGGVLTAGLNLTETTFVEAKYHYVGRYDDQVVGGIQLMFGRKF
jgi:hypothetical protein